MIAFQDFVPRQLQPPGFFTAGQYALIDCAFGVFGIIPLWLCRRDIDALVRMEAHIA